MRDWFRTNFPVTREAWHRLKSAWVDGSASDQLSRFTLLFGGVALASTGHTIAGSIWLVGGILYGAILRLKEGNQ